eukprot:13332594-Ditylum_brightwellii.AAC.1
MDHEFASMHVRQGFDDLVDVAKCRPLTQLHQNVNVQVILKEALELNYMRMLKAAVDPDLVEQFFSCSCLDEPLLADHLRSEGFTRRLVNQL